MKKYLLFFLVFVIENQWLLAQSQPEFQYTLYVEDARGKKDSIILGYDRSVGFLSLDTNFGEVDIQNRPFDSIFEVRATELRNIFNTIRFQSKKVIAQFQGDCSQIAVSSNITLLIRAKLSRMARPPN